jgi:hypothetical protein
MTTNPTSNNLINSSEWKSYHSLSDCSKMPDTIYYSYEGKIYSKGLNTNITCSAPTTEPSNVSTKYSSAKFYYSEAAANNSVSSDDGSSDSSIGDGSIDFGDPVDVSCDGIIGQEMLDFINKIFRWIQIIAPIFVIIMGGIDFAGAVLQDDKDAMKKATNKFVKRLIIAVALFFIPLILSWLLDIFNSVSSSNTSICEIGK